MSTNLEHTGTLPIIAPHDEIIISPFIAITESNAIYDIDPRKRRLKVIKDAPEHLTADEYIPLEDDFVVVGLSSGLLRDASTVTELDQYAAKVLDPKSSVKIGSRLYVRSGERYWLSNIIKSVSWKS